MPSLSKQLPEILVSLSMIESVFSAGGENPSFSISNFSSIIVSELLSGPHAASEMEIN